MATSSETPQNQAVQSSECSSRQAPRQPTLDSRPSKKRLLEILRQVTPYWYEVGILLLSEDQESHLDAIRAEYGNDNKQCCIQMFWFWLRTHPEATWQQLLDSVKARALELNAVAAKIEGICGR